MADGTKAAAATITLTPPVTAPAPQPVSVTISPTAMSLGQGQSQQFTATVTGTSNTAVTWSMSLSVGTLSTSGLYTAPASVTTQQTVKVIVTSVADTTKSASATVTLTTATRAGKYSLSLKQISATQVNVSWTAPAGHSSYDAIWLKGDDSPSWWYQSRWRTGKGTSGNFTVNMPATPGLWQFQYVGAAKNQVLARSVDLPTGVSQFSVNATPTTVAVNGKLTVSWTAPSGRPQTWADIVGLYLVGSTNDDPISYQYTLGATNGVFTLTAPVTGGVYEFRYVMDYLMGARSAPVTVH